MTQTDPKEAVRERLAAAEDIDMGPVPPAGADAPPPDGPDPDPRGDDAPPPPEAEGCHLPLNDIGNGQRFALYFGDDVLHVPRLGWHCWDGTCWRKDDDGIGTRRMAQAIPERIEAEMAHLALPPAKQRKVDRADDLRDRLDAVTQVQDKDRTAHQRRELAETKAALDEIAEIRASLQKAKDGHYRHAKQTGNTSRIENMLKEATVHVSHSIEALDANPLVVNTASGTLTFAMSGEDATITESPHAQSDLLSKCIPATYAPRTPAPLFQEFLERVQPDANMRAFLQRWFGLSMSGIPVQKLAFLYGHGANGKSVLVDLICRLLDQYSATAPIEALTGQSRRGGSDATPELIPLIGARAVRSSEPEQGERFKEGMIKALTAGEPIPVRALHSDFLFIKPFFKLTISGNHKPEIRGTDDGIWRRILLVPFDVQIPEDERDPDLGEKLWEERDGILWWLCDGLCQYLESGLQPPDKVLEATQGYRKDSDPVGAFLMECTEVTGEADDFIYSRDLIDGFNQWLEDAGETVWAGRTVSLRIKDKAERWHHPATGKTFIPGKRDRKGYRGIRFTDTYAARLREAGKPGGDAGRPPPSTDIGDF